MNIIYVFIGGGIGSVARYLISIFTIQYYKTEFPIATFITNLISCFVIGILFTKFNLGLISESNKLLLITGFCGGFSTFSALSLETMQLIEKQNYLIATFYVIASIVCGLLFFWLGKQLISL